MNTMYSYNRFNNQTTTSSFSPTNTNWFLSASNGKENVYFPNLSSYNNWAKTCCSDSYNSITTGQYQDYKIKYNKF